MPDEEAQQGQAPETHFTETVMTVPPALVEAMTHTLFWPQLSGQRPPDPWWTHEPEPALDGVEIVGGTVTVIWEAAVPRELLREVRFLERQRRLPHGALRRRRVSAQHHRDADRRYRHPFRVGEVLVIHQEADAKDPRWLDDPGAVRLPALRGFGSGMHPSTRIMLRELPRRVQAGDRVLDLGAGTGILSVVAAQRGATVVAVERNTHVLWHLGLNLEANAVADAVEVRGGGWEQVRGERFQVIATNVYGSVHIELADQYLEALVPGGVVLAGGVTPYQETATTAALTTAGFTDVQVLREADWTVVMARRPRTQRRGDEEHTR